MKFPKFSVYYILILSIILVSCGTGRISDTNSNSKNKTIVFGKLDIKNPKQLDCNKLQIHFNERLMAKNAVALDELGYFYMELPLGKNFIATIVYSEDLGFYKNIPNNYCFVELKESDKIYYLGDIDVEWEPSDTDKRQGGVLSSLKESEKKELVPIQIKNDINTIEYFKKLFPNNKKEIITNLLELKK